MTDGTREAPQAADIGSLDSRQCPPCHITFKDTKFKERHMKRHHPEDEQSAERVPPTPGALHNCTVCIKPFPTSQDLAHHYEQTHRRRRRLPDLSEPHTCADCGRAFPNTVSLHKHRLLHRGERPPQLSSWGKGSLRCRQCGACFTRACQLRQHHMNHRREPPPPPTPPPQPPDMGCKECCLSFETEAELHQHYIQHARGEDARK
ncbi:zinc finger protein 576 [Ascaphus truei]|uniref:zinc finger protein 576 n=1 Tax=Ascaphus truei TaxID=8439 RepID=UPI003F59E28D